MRVWLCLVLVACGASTAVVPERSACTQDADCTIVQQRVPECCSSCGNSRALSVADAQKVTARCDRIRAGWSGADYDRRCPRTHCACVTETPRCVERTCVVESKPCEK